MTCTSPISLVISLFLKPEGNVFIAALLWVKLFSMFIVMKICSWYIQYPHSSWHTNIAEAKWEKWMGLVNMLLLMYRFNLFCRLIFYKFLFWKWQTERVRHCFILNISLKENTSSITQTQVTYTWMTLYEPHLR